MTTPLFPEIAEGLRDAADRLDRIASEGQPPVAVIPAHRGRRTRALVLTGGAIALAALVILIAGVLPSNAPSPANLLTPRDAVAGALARLDGDGILEWTDRQAAFPSPARPTPSVEASTTIHRWIDLATGDAQVITLSAFPGRSGEHREATATTWNVGHMSWLEEGQVSKKNGKRVVRESIDPGKAAPRAAQWTPVARLRKTLRRAEAGTLPIHDAGKLHGVAVVVITDRRPGFTDRTWVTKERSPRILRSAFTMDCMKGTDCSNISDDGSPHGSSTTLSETLTWTIHPRSDAAAVAHVRAPTFDPDTYEVVVRKR